MDTPFQFHRRVRNGKVARLPEPTRERISVMIDDGVMYRDIIKSLGPPGSPALPYAISEMNLSNWRKGGYQDWRHKKLQLELGCEISPLPLDPAAQLRMLLQLLASPRHSFVVQPSGCQSPNPSTLNDPPSTRLPDCGPQTVDCGPSTNCT